jgi:hypothetical protein
MSWYILYEKQSQKQQDTMLIQNTHFDAKNVGAGLDPPLAAIRRVM